MVQMASTLLGGSDLLLTVNSPALPPQAEWDDYVAYVRSVLERRPHRGIYVLVYTLGGSPNARQRQQVLDNTPLGTRGKVAVVTSSQYARVVSKIMSAIHEPEHRSYRPEELHLALEWLGIKTLSVATVQDEIDRVLEELAIPRAALPAGRIDTPTPQTQQQSRIHG